MSFITNCWVVQTATGETVPVICDREPTPKDLRRIKAPRRGLRPRKRVTVVGVSPLPQSAFDMALYYRDPILDLRTGRTRSIPADMVPEEALRGC